MTYLDAEQSRKLAEYNADMNAATGGFYFGTPLMIIALLGGALIFWAYDGFVLYHIALILLILGGFFLNMGEQQKKRERLAAFHAKWPVPPTGA